jgi:ribokinase
LLVCGGIFREEILGRQPRLGGSGLTAALAAASAGVEVSLAGWIGADDADELFALVDAGGVRRKCVQVLAGPTTSFRISDPADLSQPHPAITLGVTPDVQRPAFPWSPVLLCFGTPGFDVIGAGWLDRTSEGATLLFDRQGVHSMIRGAPMAATVPARRRILLANAHEAISAMGAESVSQALAGLPPDGFDSSITKSGPWGVLRRDGDATERPFGAFEVDVHNTIGSGDVFAGVFAAAMALGDDMDNAVTAGNAFAAAWVASNMDYPSADLPELATTLSRRDAIWVDRRNLETSRFRLQLGPGAKDVSPDDRLDRALRYLGIEIGLGAGAELIDLASSTSADEVSLADVVQAVVAWVRAQYGVVT